jgi:N-hydroxyarylamine O-acetyltransferase
VSDEWGTDELDLPAYLNRIGQPAGEPDGATLARLQRAHVAAIGFENLDVVLGHGVAVDLAAVQDKLVERHRGGYCYEHGVLFAAVLTRLGFDVDRLLARIGHDPQRPRARTHMALRVTGSDGQWLADVGFGTGLLTPLPWTDDGREARQGGWTYRLVDDGGWQLQERTPEGWTPLYSMILEPVHASDVVMANHFTSTYPSSPFVGRIVVVHENEHHRTRLLGRELAITRPDGSTSRRDIDDHELAVLLRERFGIALTDGDLAALTT